MNKIFIKKPGNSTIVSVVVNTGSIHETDYCKGISHYVEHTCFKGNPKRTQKQISSAIDNVGGVLNAFTDNELTVYWAKVGNSYKDLARDVIVDLATEPIFPEAEIEKERDVILQEIKMGEDNPAHYVYDLFSQAVWTKESKFYLPTIGNPESLSHINRDTLDLYHKFKYNNPTLVIVGDVENKVEIEEEVRNICVPANINYNPIDNYQERKNLTQAHIVIGNVVDINYLTKLEQIFCLKILDAVYGDMSGRLFDVIREQNHLVYGVHFYNSVYQNGTLFWCVAMGLDKENIDKARNLTVQELSRPITNGDLLMALTKAIGSEEMRLDNIVNINNEVAYALVRDLDYDEIVNNYHQQLKTALNKANQLIEEINFSKNVLAGVVPIK
jgi:predicted Zn-dependent peptidase